MSIELENVYKEIELSGSLFNVLDDLFILFPEEVDKIIEMTKYYESLEDRVEEMYLKNSED